MQRPSAARLLLCSTFMLIQVHGDNHITADGRTRTEVTAQVTSALEHLREHLTRVEVHLGDESGNRQTEGDKRCMMEARIEGRSPMAVTEHAASLTEAIDGAAEKLRHLLEHSLGKAGTLRNSRATVRARH